MRNLVRGVVVVATLAAAVSCTNTVDGRPVAGPGAGPTEPTFPTRTRPSVASPTPTTSTTTTAPPTTSPRTTTPGTPSTPGAAGELPANERGVVYIQTKSGKTRCRINVGSVGCEAEFTNTPIRDGHHANGVQVGSDGSVDWVLGNIGMMPGIVTLDYRQYRAQGWTIDATFDGTTFTNIATGHGMFVSIDRVDTF